LVLRAEIRNLGRVKKVSARYIAAASQSVAAVSEVLKMCGEIFKGLVAPQQQARVERDVERCRDELRAHVVECAEKMSNMIGEIMTTRLSNLERDVDWDARGVEGLERPQDYMVELTTKIVALHDVVSSQMDRFDVADVFNRVFVLINTRIPRLYENVRPQTPQGRSRVRIDINALMSCCRRLRSVEGPGDTIDLWLEEKFGRTAPVLQPVESVADAAGGGGAAATATTTAATTTTASRGNAGRAGSQ
jgi:hypothetical protein